MSIPYARDVTIFKNSYNTIVGTSEATIWPKNTAYSFPSSASVMTLYSTSVLDTSQLVLVDGLDANYAEVSEVLMLNGQTGRQSVNQYFRINGMTVLTDSPAGDIAFGTGTALLGVPSNTYAFIKAGDNMTQATVYTVPSGYTLRIASGSISAGASTGSHNVTAKFYSRINGVRYLTSLITVANNFQFFPYTPNVEVPEKTDIYNNVLTDGGTASVSATFNGWLIKNNITRN